MRVKNTTRSVWLALGINWLSEVRFYSARSLAAANYRVADFHYTKVADTETSLAYFSLMYGGRRLNIGDFIHLKDSVRPWSHALC